MSETILVDEVFGPTLQGEGALIGRPTVFIRTGGCDFRCAWCDTMHAVDPRHKGDWTPWPAALLARRVDELAGCRPILVTISGGNPALWSLGPLIDQLHSDGHLVALETQGTIAKPWMALLDHLTISPKPPSSGMAFDIERLRACVSAGQRAAITLKIVIADDDDYKFARDVADRFPALPLYLQPCNDINNDAVAEDRLNSLRWLAGKVTADHWHAAHVLPQLHVQLWGARRGV